VRLWGDHRPSGRKTGIGPEAGNPGQHPQVRASLIACKGGVDTAGVSFTDLQSPVPQCPRPGGAAQAGRECRRMHIPCLSIHSHIHEGARVVELDKAAAMLEQAQL